MTGRVDVEIASILWRIGSFGVNPESPLMFKSGIYSPIYTDCRLLISHVMERRRVAGLLANEAANCGQVDLIAGTATAGIPHAAWVSELLGLPMVYVRGDAKEHGKQNQIEGVVIKGQRTVVVEDLISTAGSSITTADALRNAGAEVVQIVAIFDYLLPQSRVKLSASNLQLKSLTNRHAALVAEEKLGILRDVDRQAILDWAFDPVAWTLARGGTVED